MTLLNKVSELKGNAETPASFPLRALVEDPTLAPDHVRQQDAFQTIKRRAPHFGDVESMGNVVDRHCAVHAADLVMYQTGKPVG